MLVLLIGTAGLYAIHRTVAVVVHFAERRNNFVAAVTHELKTPLTAIRMYGEMLRDGLVPSDEKRREYYGTISDESERLSRLIDNVLEFSRLERGRREMSWSVGAVGPVIEEAARKLRTHAEREGFSLEISVESDLPPVRFDRDALLQVLFNLVDNAMKYAAAAGRREVVLEARRRDATVEIAVRDFGPGVSARHLARIFEPFLSRRGRAHPQCEGHGHRARAGEGARRPHGRCRARRERARAVASGWDSPSRWRRPAERWLVLAGHGVDQLGHLAADLAAQAL